MRLRGRERHRRCVRGRARLTIPREETAARQLLAKRCAWPGRGRGVRPAARGRRGRVWARRSRSCWRARWLSGLCGGSPATIAALAAEGGAAASAAAAGAAVNDTPKERSGVRAVVCGGSRGQRVRGERAQAECAGDGRATTDRTPPCRTSPTRAGIEQQGDAVSVDVAEDSLSCREDLGAAALPWGVSVTYELDGKRVDADRPGRCERQAGHHRDYEEGRLGRPGVLRQLPAADHRPVRVGPGEGSGDRRTARSRSPARTRRSRSRACPARTARSGSRPR